MKQCFAINVFKENIWKITNAEKNTWKLIIPLLAIIRTKKYKPIPRLAMLIDSQKTHFLYSPILCFSSQSDVLVYAINTIIEIKIIIISIYVIFKSNHMQCTFTQMYSKNKYDCTRSFSYYFYFLTFFGFTTPLQVVCWESWLCSSKACSSTATWCILYCCWSTYYKESHNSYLANFALKKKFAKSQKKFVC